MDAIDIITIVLSLVALAVTVIGFFASLKFYRDGVEMQTRATNALAKIEERAAAIQSQVGGMFDKTLDAALGRSNPREAQRQQKELEEAITPAPAAIRPPVVSPSGGAARTIAEDTTSGADLALTAFRYFVFRQLRYTDVSKEPARSVFLLGGGGGFNLFDGIPGVVFFGYFHTLQPEEIVARVRALFTNLELAYKRLGENPQQPQVPEVRRLLDSILVHLLIPEDVDTSKLAGKIDEFQPNARKIAVTLLKPSDIKRMVEEEYRRMRI